MIMVSRLTKGIITKLIALEKLQALDQIMQAPIQT